MKINSKKANLSASSEATYQFLSDFQNFSLLLPQDRVVVKEQDPNKIVFEIKGMATIGMEVQSRNPGIIKAISFGKNPFPFTLDIMVQESDNGSEAFIEFNGEMNSFLQMMVEKPLTNFFNSLIEELENQNL